MYVTKKAVPDCTGTAFFVTYISKAVPDCTGLKFKFTFVKKLELKFTGNWNLNYKKLEFKFKLELKFTFVGFGQ